jgi:hypothetical protein
MAYSRIRFEIQNSATMTLVQGDRGEFAGSQVKGNSACYYLRQNNVLTGILFARKQITSTNIGA